MACAILGPPMGCRRADFERLPENMSCDEMYIYRGRGGDFCHTAVSSSTQAATEVMVDWNISRGHDAHDVDDDACTAAVGELCMNPGGMRLCDGASEMSRAREATICWGYSVSCEMRRSACKHQPRFSLASNSQHGQWHHHQPAGKA